MSATLTVESEGLRASFAKAEARDPILGASLGFLPADSRPAHMAWAALLNELRESVFECSDSRITDLKVGWWADELDGLARGAARHPVSRSLLRYRLPFALVAESLRRVIDESDPAPDTEAAIAKLTPLARSLIEAEHALFAVEGCRNTAARSLVVHWLRHRLAQGLETADRARIPLVLFARHRLRREQLASSEAVALRRDWAENLLATLPADDPGWAYARRLLRAADRHALARAVRGQSPQALAGFAAVWRAWRQARNTTLHGLRSVSGST